MTGPRRLSRSQAAAVAIRAQRLDRVSPARTRADIGSAVRGMGVLQIDSVNILARAHYLPLYSRLGPYDTGLLDAAASQPPRLIVEQWGHEACYVPPTTHRLLAGFRRRWSSGRTIEEHPGAAALAERIMGFLEGTTATAREVSAWLDTRRLTPAEAELIGQSTEFEWSRTAVKVILENLFDADMVAGAGRTQHFHRIYGARERVLPAGLPPTPPREEAIRALTEISLEKVGIGTPATIADFFRLKLADVRPVLDDLVACGKACRVDVEGLPGAIMWAAIPVPRSVTGTTLLSPFDPLIFERKRALALFGLDYRIGIYTPAAKRTRGYYSLPLLHDGMIPARVDLALDRPSQTLKVMGAWFEPGAREAGAVLAAELERLARWQGASTITIVDDAPGDAVPAIRAAL